MQGFYLKKVRNRGEIGRMCRKCEKVGINSNLFGILVRKVGINVGKVEIILQKVGINFIAGKKTIKKVI
jgi:hypothetical protein